MSRSDSQMSWLLWFGFVLITAGLVGLGLKLGGWDVTSLWIDFIGAWHPVILHLPIGIMVWIGIQRVWASWRGQPALGNESLLWAVAALTATGSFITGYAWGMAGGYDEVQLNRHLWAAVGFTVVCWWGWLAELTRMSAGLKGGTIIAGLIAVLLTGHWGGLMVHGDPLAAAPWRNDPQRFAQFGEFGDQINVYEELVHPIMGAKCMVCHGAAKQNGKLRLDSFEAIMRGGDQGRVVAPGDVENSDLIGVILLPMAHDDHMPPPNRPQITDTELAALIYWVDSGAAADQVIAKNEVPAELRPLLEPSYRLLEDPVALAAREVAEETERMRMADRRKELAAVLAGLPEALASSFSFEDLTSDRLRFSPATHRHALTSDDLVQAREALQACVDIDLSRLAIDGAVLAELKQATHLQSLNLAGCEIGDELFDDLGPLPELQRLSLFATQITRVPANLGSQLPALEQLFVGGTGVDVASVRAQLPGVEVIGDLVLPPRADDVLFEEEEDSDYEEGEE